MPVVPQSPRILAVLGIHPITSAPLICSVFLPHLVIKTRSFLKACKSLTLKSLSSCHSPQGSSPTSLSLLRVGYARFCPLSLYKFFLPKSGSVQFPQLKLLTDLSPYITSSKLTPYRKKWPYYSLLQSISLATNCNYLTVC